MPRLNLPSARSTVNRGIQVCARMGYTKPQALDLIQRVCEAAVAKSPSGQGFDQTWLMSVYLEAQWRERKLRASRS